VFRTEGLATGKKLVTFLYAHKKELDGIAAKTSRHIRLTDVVVKGIGKLVFVRLTFDTSEAMGMNMVTLATSAIASYVTQKTGARLVSLAGNYDSDKKPSWINFIRGRGWEVRAEATIPAGILQDTLKTTAKELYDVWLAKCMIGSAMTGSMGFNAHFANIIAALFLATGQDPAHVVEGSLGITTAEVLDSDLYISVFLPDLMVGTVGGGTGLATQKEALAIIGAKNTEEFARVVGAAALAGELSLLASLAEGTLAKSHKRLARAKT
jgi:hydroxymethylglutaryl-CoA reductase (NADPH)